MRRPVCSVENIVCVYMCVLWHVLCTWHLIPAMLQAQVSGSQKTLQSQPQSSLETRMARSSCFSSTSIFFTPDDRSSARRFLVVSGCRKKYSSTSVLSRSRSSSEISSSVSALASSDSAEPLFVSWGVGGYKNDTET